MEQLLVEPCAPCLATALTLIERGIPIVVLDPDDGGKRPKGIGPGNKDWQNVRWSADVATKTFNFKPELNLGVLLGPEAGVDIEFDSADERIAFDALFAGVERPKTPSWKSKRGEHYWFAFPPEFANVTAGVIHFHAGEHKVAVRTGCGKAAQSVIPPSCVDGFRRTWITSIDECPPAELPPVVVQRILSSYQPKPVATAPPPNDGGAISQAALAAMIETTKNKQDRNNGSSRLYICCCRAVEHNLSDAATIATVRAYEAVRPFTLARWSDGDIIERLRDAEGTATRGDALDWYERFPLNPLKVVEPQTDAKVETPAVQLPRPVKFGRLLADHPDMAQPIIDGLLRRGETMNVIASPKRGKSWLVYGLALSTCLGRRWLDSFECSPSRVCILDNELHPATLAHRIPIVADAMGLELADYQDRLDIISLRGHLIDLKGVRDVLEKIEANTYDLIVLDAFYRVLPAGVSENDNAAIADLFNQIDKMTARLKCAWVNIHHSSKGAQGQRSVVDVGAGAGAQSRAADTHLVLREHDEDGCVVLDSAVRSFPPIERVVLRWEFPLWERADSLDPTAIKGRGARQENQAKSDKEGTPDVLAALDKNWQTERAIRKAAGMGLDRCVRLLKPMLERGTVQSRPAVRRGKDCTEYRLV